MITTTSPSYKWWLLALVMISTAMAVLDTTIVNSGIPILMRDFSETLSRAEWIVTGYLISMCVMLPTAGWMAQKWGYKRVYLTGLIVFTVGSLLCTFSQNTDQLIASRVIEGFGSGAVQSLGMAIIIRHFDGRMRGIALGLWAVSAAAAVSMGPYLGGLLLTDYSWNSLFVINVPFGVLGIVGTAIVMKEVRDEGMGRFDLLGFLLVAIATPLLVVALSMGASRTVSAFTGWSSPFVIGSLVASLLMLAWFVDHTRRSKSPIIDLTIFTKRTFALAIVALTFFGIGLFGGNYLLPLYLEHSLNYSALAAGSVYLPVGIIQGTLAPLTGVVAKWTGERVLVISGLIIFTSYFALSALFDTTTPAWLISTTVYLRGVGIGLSFTPLNTLAVSELTHSQMTSASGVSNTVKQVSGSIGIAIFTALIASGVSTAATHAVAEQNYVHSIDWSFGIAALFSLLGLITVLFIRKKG